MTKSKPSKALIRTTLAAAITMAVAGVLAFALGSAEAKSDPPAPKTDAVAAKTNSAELKAGAPAPRPAAPKKTLTGAELYSMHCNRCHPERYPTERTAAQWKTITLHMQVRANLPGQQARLILKYLQENSGR